MIHWDTGIVIEIIEQRTNLQILLIEHKEGRVKALHYLQLHPPLHVGEQVIINRTATLLGLGTGGYDFVVAPIQIHKIKKQHDYPQKGHIMKLRYTPYQFSVLSCEEQDSQYHDIFTEYKKIKGLPVIIGELHSMLPIIITIFRQLEEKYHQKKHNIVYIMTDGAALPIAISNHVEQLKKIGWLNHTITVGNAFGGDLEAINIYSALIAAKYILEADIVVVMMGPGITGTGTTLGHTGIEQGLIVNAVSTLEGQPISIIRSNLNDKRNRHQGISHHSITNLKDISIRKSIVPYPEYLGKEYPELLKLLYDYLGDKHQLVSVPISNKEITNFLGKYPYTITTMGKTIKEDPIFFGFVASAAYWLFKDLTLLK